MTETWTVPSMVDAITETTEDNRTIYAEGTVHVEATHERDGP